MRILLSFFFILITTILMSAQSGLYISDKAHGHKVEFLIISNDTIILESYTAIFKLLNPLSRKINKHHIIQKSNGVIKTDKFDIHIKSDNLLEIGKNQYFKDFIIEIPGDFLFIDKSFGRTSNDNRLQSCRAYYTKQKKQTKVGSYDYTNKN